MPYEVILIETSMQLAAFALNLFYKIVHEGSIEPIRLLGWYPRADSWHQAGMTNSGSSVCDRIFITSYHSWWHSLIQFYWNYSSFMFFSAEVSGVKNFTAIILAPYIYKICICLHNENLGLWHDIHFSLSGMKGLQHEPRDKQDNPSLW